MDSSSASSQAGKRGGQGSLTAVFGGTFPRIARARQLGFEGFVEERLHPEAMDDSEVETAARDHFPPVGMRQLALEEHDRLHVAYELKAPARSAWHLRGAAGLMREVPGTALPPAAGKSIARV